MKWRAAGILVVIFFDDGIVGSYDYQTCEKSAGIVFADLMACHILPNAHKSNWKPKTVTTWLGYDWDYEKGGGDGVSEEGRQII